jgi:hypothetical protein
MISTLGLPNVSIRSHRDTAFLIPAILFLTSQIAVSSLWQRSVHLSYG